MRPKSLASTRADRGAVAVEFGLLLPLLLLILLGIIDFGFMLNAKVTVTQAAREGARLEAVGQHSEVSTRASAAASPLPVSTEVVLTCPGTDAEVKVTHQYTFKTPVGSIAAMFGGGDFGDPLSISATGVIPCET